VLRRVHEAFRSRSCSHWRLTFGGQGRGEAAAREAALARDLVLKVGELRAGRRTAEDWYDSRLDQAVICHADRPLWVPAADSASDAATASRGASEPPLRCMGPF
jgi:hypothetical protein